MNLVTADNFTLVKKDGKINIFIGSWCLSNDKIKENFNKDTDKIAKYHWDDKEKMFKDIIYIEKIYKYFLKKLSKNLNDFHNTNYNSESWETLIGLWLRYYISFLFDRWEQVSSVEKNYKISEAQIVEFDEERFITSNLYDFQYMIFHSNWNHWIFGKIIENKSKFNFSLIKDKDQLNKSPIIAKEGKNFFIRFFNKIFAGIIFKQKLAIANLYLPKLYKFGLLYKYNKFIAKLDFDKKLKKNVNINSRIEFFKNITGIDDFSNFALSLIYLNMPCSYLENFKALNKKIEDSILPKKPKIIFTSIEHVCNDFFQLYCIKKKTEGAKLVVFQHGSHFVNKNSLGDDLEADVTDKFLTWGTSPKPNKTEPLFISSVIKKKIKKKFFNKGILISHFMPFDFPGHYDSSPRYYSDTVTYNNTISSLLSNIDKKIFLSSNIKVNKDLSEQYKIFWPIKFLKKNFPGIKLISCRDPVWKISNKYKIVVETHNSTGFLEDMYLNIPVILLIDPKVNQFKSEYESYYEDLKKVKILHYDGENAAKFINSIYDNPLKWWNEKNTQKVRKIFCSKFAMHKKNPYEELVNTLNSVLNRN